MRCLFLMFPVILIPNVSSAASCIILSGFSTFSPCFDFLQFQVLHIFFSKNIFYEVFLKLCSLIFVFIFLQIFKIKFITTINILWSESSDTWMSLTSLIILSYEVSFCNGTLVKLPCIPVPSASCVCVCVWLGCCGNCSWSRYCFSFSSELIVHHLYFSFLFCTFLQML